jgi:hypothetical protein
MSLSGQHFGELLCLHTRPKLRKLLVSIKQILQRVAFSPSEQRYENMFLAEKNSESFFLSLHAIKILANFFLSIRPAFSTIALSPTYRRLAQP